jgi:hypothetical protein
MNAGQTNATASKISDLSQALPDIGVKNSQQPFQLICNYE